MTKKVTGLSVMQDVIAPMKSQLENVKVRMNEMNARQEKGKSLSGGMAALKDQQRDAKYITESLIRPLTVGSERTRVIQ